MTILAANVTDETETLIDNILASDEFVRFNLQNKLNLKDNTVLLRTALVNFFKHLPSNEEIASYKAALLRPKEFDDFLRGRLKN